MTANTQQCSESLREALQVSNNLLHSAEEKLVTEIYISVTSNNRNSSLRMRRSNRTIDIAMVINSSASGENWQ